MPYISGAILGVSIIAIGVLLSFFQSMYLRLSKKHGRIAKRQKRLDAGRKPLPYTIFPFFEGRARRASGA
jgi:hypothetical protein